MSEKNKGGRPRLFKHPKELTQAWENYKESVDSNPDKIQRATNKGIQIEEVKKPYLRQGFISFCIREGIGDIHHYLDGDYKEFRESVSRIRNEWQDDQLTGAITGRYKAAQLIASLCNVIQKQEVKQEIDISKLPPYMRPDEE